MISHFHPDHIFGLMAEGDERPGFPNAEIVVSVPEYRFWTDPAVIEKLPEARRPLARRIQATFPTWKNVRQVEGEAEVAPGIRTVAAPGHTPGHIAFHLASGDAQMIYSGDTFYQPALSLRTPHWQGVFDQDGPTAEQSRRSWPTGSWPTRSWCRAITSPGPAPAPLPATGRAMRSRLPRRERALARAGGAGRRRRLSGSANSQLGRS